MGTNFYFILDDGEREHIGKRSAAGLYCWDCKRTLCEAGESGLHRGGAFHKACPGCSKTVDAGTKGGAAAVELGWAKPETERPKGVTNVASFSWAMKPEQVEDRCRREIVFDQYDRAYSGAEFLLMLENNCPIRFFHVGKTFS